MCVCFQPLDGAAVNLQETKVLMFGTRWAPDYRYIIFGPFNSILSFNRRVSIEVATLALIMVSYNSI